MAEPLMSVRGCGLVALLLVGCDATQPETAHAPADAGAGEVEFEMAGAHEAAVVVPVTLNGAGPFRFVLDTGATITCVDQALADSLGLPEQEGVQGFGAGVGGQGRVRILRIDSIAVGAATATDLPACALDLGGLGRVDLDVDGLLGLNFLQSFLVTLDFERDVLTLQSR